MVKGKRVLGSYILVIGVGILVLVAAAFVFVHREIRETFDLDYGIKPFAVVGGRQVYLKRDAGVNYDRVGLSLNGDRCVELNVSTDYMFRSLDAGEFPIYYAPGDRALTVYEYVVPPTKLDWGITVNQVIPNATDSMRVKENYPDREASKIEIKAGELSPCH